MTMTHDPVVIYRRKKRPTGKATYWVDDARYGTIQINSDRAKGMVAIGAAVWAGDPIVTDLVKE